MSQRALVVHLSYFDNFKTAKNDRSQRLVHRMTKLLNYVYKYAKKKKKKITLKAEDLTTQFETFT